MQRYFPGLPHTFGSHSSLILKQASLLETVSLIAIIILLTVALPLISHLLVTRYGWSARAKDLRLSQLSALLTAVGCLLMGVAQTIPLFAASLVVYSLGTGYTFMLRGLMTSLVGGKDIGLLYSSIAFIDAASLIIGLPLFSWLFKVGMSWGPAWVGLPFLVAGVVLVGAALLVGAIRGAYVDVGEEGGNASERIDQDSRERDEGERA